MVENNQVSQSRKEEEQPSQQSAEDQAITKEIDEINNRLATDPVYAAEIKVKRMKAFEQLILAQVEEQDRLYKEIAAKAYLQQTRGPDGELPVPLEEFQSCFKCDIPQLKKLFAADVAHHQAALDQVIEEKSKADKDSQAQSTNNQATSPKETEEVQVEEAESV